MKTNQDKKVLLLTLILSLFWFTETSASFEFVLDETVTNLADGLNDGDTIISNDVTLSFSNVVTSDGLGNGEVDDFGILISGIIDNTYSDVVSFGFSFDQDIIIDSYDIGAREDIPANVFFTVSGNNGTSGNNSIPQFSGFTEQEINLVFDDGSIPFFQANQVYIFNHNLPNDTDIDALFNLESLTVSTVPEPSAYVSILGVMSLLFTFLRRRKKCNKSL